jgi:hypothetical protein
MLAAGAAVSTSAEDPDLIDEIRFVHGRCKLRHSIEALSSVGIPKRGESPKGETKRA